MTIWCNADVGAEGIEALRRGVGEHRLLLASEQTNNLSSTGRNPLLAEAEIAFGQPDPQQAMELPGLRWIHLTSAGYTRYDSDGFREAIRARGAVMTNSSSVFDEACAQQLMAFMLALARQLPESLADQLGRRGWRYEQLRAEARLLTGQTAVILGFGAIARRLSELLSPFRMEVIGVRRTVRGDEPVATRPINELDELLPKADHVINILPANLSTERLMNRERFAQMKPGSNFYNIGRGTTVDQDALIAALESGQIGAAYLDVTDPEPLPSDHPLWTTHNCYITPHVAGGHRGEMLHIVQHFLENLRLYESGSQLRGRVI
ncbi:MAG: D-2-hydroxyacid dehydrogenase [Fimbriimonas sp.]